MPGHQIAGERLIYCRLHNLLNTFFAPSLTCLGSRSSDWLWSHQLTKPALSAVYIRASHSIPLFTPIVHMPSCHSHAILLIHMPSPSCEFMLFTHRKMLREMEMRSSKMGAMPLRDNVSVHTNFGHFACPNPGSTGKGMTPGGYGYQLGPETWGFTPVFLYAKDRSTGSIEWLWNG